MATTNGSFNQQDQYKSAPEQYTATQGAAETTNGSNGNADLSKDEIGWYFVEQYYTTLSRSPEKLHLFYGKRSQFVSGPEAEVSNVSVGRSAIQERIKSLDFQDCKVRVSNVDSQASDENIVIQVIGETSNKSAELKKFVQTFVLAQQPSGYFVLNDIFRYIKEEGEEEIEAGTAEETPAQEPLTEDVEMPKAEPAAEQPSTEALDAGVIDEKLEKTIQEEPETSKAASINGDAAQDTKVEEVTEAAPAADEKSPTPEQIEKELEEEEIKEPEKPKDPVPTPSISRGPSSAKVPTANAGPAKPLSWANRAAAAAAAAPTPRPAVPAPKATSPAQTQTRAPPAAQAAQSTPAPATAAATESKEKENENSQQSGWQTAGSDNAKRQNRPQSVSNPQEKEGTMGYVRNVSDAVKTEELRTALSKFGELVYFDVNRQKNCAFVEFASTTGYQAAAGASPLKIAGEDIFVEPRRPKSSAYGGSGYTGGRGGLNTRGRGGFDGRQGGQRGGRGDFGNRGRGAPRGRGGSAAPAAA